MVKFPCFHSQSCSSILRRLELGNVRLRQACKVTITTIKALGNEVVDYSFSSRNSQEPADAANLAELEKSRLPDRRDMRLEGKVGVKNNSEVLGSLGREESVSTNNDVRLDGV